MLTSSHGSIRGIMASGAAFLLTFTLSMSLLPSVFAERVMPQATNPPISHGRSNRDKISTEQWAREVYTQQPMSFETNVGQVNSPAEFFARGTNYALHLMRTEAVMSLTKAESGAKEEGGPSLSSIQFPAVTAGNVIQMKLVGANRSARISGEEKLPGRVNYFRGASKRDWQTGISRYAKVRYKSVYPGVDMLYYGNQRQLEYDFVLAPGSDPHVIEIEFSGVNKVEIDAHGDLVLQTSGGVISQHAPFVYQETEDGRRAIAGSYVRHGDRRIGFQIGSYDKEKPLVIDPVLSYSTYLGGEGYERPSGIAVDGSGNVYISGTVVSTDFPVSNNAFQSTKRGSGSEFFITKLRFAGGGAGDLVYSTYLGGSSDEMVSRLISDRAGNVYLVGTADSTDFPTTPNSFRPSTFSGGGVLAKLNPAGDLAYSTYLNGYYVDVALGPEGTVLVSGVTYSSGFPLTANAMLTTPPDGPPSPGRGAAFLQRLKLNGSGQGDLIYSSYAHASAIAVDSVGNVYLGGVFQSENRPTTPNAIFTSRLNNDICYQATSGNVPCNDIYIQKLRLTNAGGYELAYGTWLGGKGDDKLTDIAIDAQGFIYATGTTSSTLAPWIQGNSNVDDFPVTDNAIQKKNNGGDDAFITKIDSTSASGGLAGLSYSTLIGGSGKDHPVAVLVNADGNAYIAGDTDSADFVITANVLQATYGGGLGNTISRPGGDGFVVKLNRTGSALDYSTYLGTTSGEAIDALAVDGNGNAYVTGYTWSTQFPVTTGAFQPRMATNQQGVGIDVFVTKIGERTTPGVPGYAEGMGAFNVIDDSMSFVREQYRDFLSREADDDGLRFWTNEITQCGGDQECRSRKRINVSAAFFLSIESQQTAYFFYRLNKATFDGMPRMKDLYAATQMIGRGVVVNQPGWEIKLRANTQAFVENWVTRDEFTTVYGARTNENYVDILFANAGVTPTAPERETLVAGLNNGETRASVLMKVVGNATFARQELNRAFVLTEYFGYLRRDPDSGQDTDLTGFNFWLNKLNEHNGNYVEAEMVKSFLDSSEYRKRFGPQ